MNRFYYVSVIDGDEYGLLAGPYETKEMAESRVNEVKAIAKKVNRAAVFYSFGTCSTKTDAGPGLLNKYIGE